MKLVYLKEQMIYLCVLLTMLIVATEELCPSDCLCLERSVDCHNGRLESVPILLSPRIRSLSLARNRLETVSADQFIFYPDLEYLDISHNIIMTLARATFYHLSAKLKILKLNGNKLKTLDIETFLGLAGLHLLDLSENEIERLSTSTFADLPRLQLLNLSYNHLDRVSSGAFAGLTRLKQLHLKQNNLQSIPSTALHTLTKLQLLDLSFNKIQSISNISLGALCRLELFKLEHNEIYYVDDEAFFGLQNLRQLYLGQNKLQKVPSVAFRPLTELESLDLSGNDLVVLHTSAFEGLARLRQLTVANCLLLRTVQMNAFSGLYALQQLSLTHNRQLSYISPQAFEKRNDLKVLELNNNALETVDEALIDWSRLENLDISGNPWNCVCMNRFLSTILNRVYSGSEDGAVCARPTRLKHVHLRHLDTTTECLSIQKSAIIFTVLSLLLLTLFIVLLAFHWRTALQLSRAEYCNLCNGHSPLPTKRPSSRFDSDCYSHIRTLPNAAFPSSFPPKQTYRVISNFPIPITEL